MPNTDLPETINRKSSQAKLLSRRRFLKGAAAVGVVATLYAAPKFQSFGPKPAYASMTGSTHCLSFIDFDTIGGLGAGDRIGTYRKRKVAGVWIVDTLPGGLQPWSTFGVTVETLQRNQNKFHKKGAMIFDSANPTGGDSDLGTPNASYGGPGIGAGGTVIGAGNSRANDTAIHNILIVSEDGDTNDPDDDARGGVIVFQFDTPRIIKSIDMIDIDDGNSTYQTRIRAFSSQADLTASGFSTGEPGGLLKSTDVPDVGNNSWQQVHYAQAGVRELRIRFKSSGAIGRIDFDCP